jgi:catechol 2,3-dioxygenase-like lactoylglutathione lyase family enzyme
MNAPAKTTTTFPHGTSAAAARPTVGLPNGLHHLAIATRDAKAQIEFFTDVIGLELVGLYWMHGVANTVHAFLRLSDTASIALVQGPEMEDIEPRLGVSHAGFTAGPVAPGAVQHVALNVDSVEALLAMRDRIRSRGYWVMGPIDHGMCKSIYLAAPEGLQLELAAWTGGVEAERWVDPEVAAFCGIGAADLARYRRPADFASRGGTVAQPDPRERGGFVFPDEMREVGASLLAMSDAELAAALDHPEPPVPARPADAGAPRSLSE